MDWDDFPVILGQGSMHSLSNDDGGKTFGKEGARIRVRIKRNPIGFHIPRKAPAAARKPSVLTGRKPVS